MKKLITLFALLTMFAIGAQAQIVGANEGPKTSTNTTSSLYKPTGHYMRFELGLIWGSVAYDYQINPYIMVGGGVGVGLGSEGILYPIYAEAIFSTPRNKWSFYSEIKLGYAIDEDSFFPSLTIGVNYKNFGLGIGCYMNKQGSWSHIIPRFTASYKLPLKVYR